MPSLVIYFFLSFPLISIDTNSSTVNTRKNKYLYKEIGRFYHHNLTEIRRFLMRFKNVFKYVQNVLKCTF